MKKTILTLCASALFGVVLISCNNQTNEKVQAEDSVVVTEDELADAEPQAELIEEETAAEPVETEDEIAEDDSIMDELISDVDKIEEKGKDFVKTIQDGSPADAIRSAQDDFQSAIADAHESYQEAIQAGKTGDDLTEVQRRMESVIQNAQRRAQQAMNERS